MKHSRFPLIPTNTDRAPFDSVSTSYGTGIFEEDAAFVNGMVVRYPGEQPKVRTRPGMKAGDILDASGSEGRGVYYWDNTAANYYVVDSTVYKETTALDGNLETSTGYIHWDTALSNGGLLLFHDGERLYTVDTSDKVTCVNAPAWQASTAYAVGDFVTNDTDKVYIVASVTGTNTSAGSGGPTGTGSGITDNDVTWDYVNTVTGGSNIPTDIVSGLIVLNQYVFLGDSDGTIFNSNVADVFTWTAGDQINSEILSDKMIAIGRNVNYLVAYGTKGTEFFYDAANPNNSPLSRLQGTFKYVGCAYGDTVVNIEKDTMWVSQNQIGVLGISLLSGLDIQKIPVSGTVASILNQYRATEAMWEAYFYELFGKKLYVLSIATSSTDVDGTCLIFDLDEQLWYSWGSLSTILDDNDESIIGWPYRGSAQSSSPGSGKNIETITRLPFDNEGITTRTVREDSSVDQYHNGSTYTSISVGLEIQTPAWDLGTTLNKFVHRIELVGDQQGSVEVSWQDDDEHTTSPTFTTARTIDLEDDESHLTRCGVTRSRRFRITSSASETDPIRLEALDIYFTLGTFGQTH